MISFFNVVVLYGVAINLVTFFLFGWDKYLARTHGRRISEKNLLRPMVFGGFLGALAGQSYFYHKTIKSSFVWKFRAIVAVWMLIVLFFIV